MKKQIIFDLGGVLFHWNPKAVFKILLEQDPHFPENIHEMTLSKIWLDFDAGLANLDETIETLAKTYNKEHVQKFINLSLDKLDPIEHGVKLLEMVQKKGHSTFILSNISEEFLNRLLPKHLFLNSFTGAVFSYEVKIIKPHEKIYQALLEKYNLDPRECIFIDDSPANIQKAKDLGIDGILCQDHWKVEQELKDRNVL